jgi:folate-binding protein YgfZ
MVSVHSSTVREQYEAARRHVAVIDRSNRGWIVVSGKDRASYLQGLLTNDVAALTQGAGCYAAYLTPQGRMISDLWVYELGDSMLVALGMDVKDAVLTKLDHLIFTEDVQLRDISHVAASVAVVGPAAAATAGSLLTGVSSVELDRLPEHGNARARFGDREAIVMQVTDTGEPGYELHVEHAVRPALMEALAAAGAVEVAPSVAETLRIEAGIPRFHLDMDEQTIPLEAGIEARAISFTKGCYVGQEVIVRVLHRGHGRVARRLVGITIQGGAGPARGVSVRQDGREVGRITSSAHSSALDRPIALAYVDRDSSAPGTSTTVEGIPAFVTALPFVARPSGTS